MLKKKTISSSIVLSWSSKLLPFLNLQMHAINIWEPSSILFLFADYCIDPSGLLRSPQSTRYDP